MFGGLGKNEFTSRHFHRTPALFLRLDAADKFFSGSHLWRECTYSWIFVWIRNVYPVYTCLYATVYLKRDMKIFTSKHKRMKFLFCWLNKKKAVSIFKFICMFFSGNMAVYSIAETVCSSKYFQLLMISNNFYWFGLPNRIKRILLRTALSRKITPKFHSNQIFSIPNLDAKCSNRACVAKVASNNTEALKATKYPFMQRRCERFHACFEWCFLLQFFECYSFLSLPSSNSFHSYKSDDTYVSEDWYSHSISKTCVRLVLWWHR